MQTELLEKAGGFAGAGDLRALRHRMWVRRAKKDTPKGAWAHRKTERGPAKKWCDDIDGKIQTSTIYNGLKHFTKDDRDCWKDWRTWPTLQISRDFEAPGCSGMKSLEYFFLCNVVDLPDQSHAFKCVSEIVWKAMGVYDFILLMLITWNLPWSPDDESMRRDQLEEVLNNTYNTVRMEDCAEFIEYAPKMVQELQAAGFKFPGVESIEVELWKFLKARAAMRRHGRKTSMVRFGAALSKLKEERGLWTVTLFERTVMAVDLDFLSGAAMMKKVALKGGSAEGIDVESGALPSTNPKKVQLADRTLRGCAQNNVGVSILTLGEPDHQRTAAIIDAVMDLLLKMHGEQNQALRSVGDAEKWFYKMIVEGQFMRNMTNYFSKLEDPAALTSCEFFLGSKVGDTDGLNDILFVEEEFANTYGQFCMALPTETTRRMLWMFGWPHGFIRLLCKEQECHTINK